jgi:phosphate-selective porin
MKQLLVLFSFYLFISPSALGQTAPPKKQWFESIQLRGYMQVRYNRLLETNPSLQCAQCDRSWGDNGGFFIRRMRLIFSGQISERVYFYIQPDLVSNPSSTATQYAQIRDAYVDVGLDAKNEFRLRIGQSKVPFGFENMQSSQNRIPLDRNDALNSAVSNERDLGVFFYWAPQNIRTLYASLVNDGLKGSGDYGVFSFGAYNGQTANRAEANNSPHVVSRFSFPFAVNKQIVEMGVQAYTGQYILTPDLINAGVKLPESRSFLDQRVAGSFVLYPKPFGIQAEYNIGRGPRFNKESDSVEVSSLKGGYITASYKTHKGKHIIIPFSRYQYYQGGKKHEMDAMAYDVKELEVGVEWQPNKNIELVTMYTFSDRRFESFKNQNNRQKGSLLRLQLQLNF